MHLLARSLGLLLALAAVSAFAQTPTFTVVNTGLDATFGNAGKAVLDPQAVGFVGVAYGNGLFVAVCASTKETVIRWATSPDGTTWTGRSQALPDSTLVTFQTSKVHYLNGKFIFFTGFGDTLGGVAGTTWCYSSADGLTWTANKVTDGRINVQEFDASPTLYVAAASNGAQVASTDLVTWVSRPVVANAVGFDHLDLAYSNGKFFSSINGFGGTTYSSSDAETWTALSSLTVPGGSRVEAGNGILVASANGFQYQSADGVAFTKLTTTAPTGWFPPGGTPRFTSAGFVAQSVDLSTGKSGYMVSADGASWTPVGYLPANPTPQSGFLVRSYLPYDIAYGNGTYVLVGQDNSQAAFSIQNLPLVLTVTGAAAPAPAVITTQPQSQSVVAGGTAVFTVVATGGTSYQWKLNNVALTGATSATLMVHNATSANAGSYTVDITNDVGTTTSSAVTLTLVDASSAGHIVNVSIRGFCGTADQALIVGTVVGGPGAKPTLVRAAGPTLGDYGVSGALADPQLRLAVQATGATIAENDNWAGDADIVQLSARVGAFPFANVTSKDAALYAPALEPAPYSIVVTGVAGGTGPLLAEVYDAQEITAYNATSGRLINISGRGYVGSGSDIMIAGFVVRGATSLKVLVRGVGPTLGSYGVAGTLADPTLTLFANGNATAIAANNDWETNDGPAIAATSSTVGAFPLVAGSKDAAFILTLEPGAYTVQLAGADATTGVGLIEVYEIP